MTGSSTTDPLARIRAIESRHLDVMIWTPGQSASGQWEASGDGWDIVQPDMEKFAAMLEARLAA